MENATCAHGPCTCRVEGDEQYCSHACSEDATQGEIAAMHGGCRCSHPECEAR